MQIKNILLIGGSGFLGSRVAHKLAACGYRVTVPTRRRERAKHLILLPTVDVVEANVHDPVALGTLVNGQDVVINLVGVLHSRNGTPYGRDFAAAHVALPRKIVTACRFAGVQRLIHVGALKSAADAPSAYLRSKADGEAAIMAASDQMEVTVFRPSVVFGPGDAFLTLFAGLLARLPFVPLACPNARFQPIYVDDVATVLVHSLTDPASFGHGFDLCGPRQYRLRELVELVGTYSGHARPIINLGPGMSWLQALMLEVAPGRMMTRDNVRSMQVDNVCGSCVLPFAFSPTALETIAPAYLGHMDPRDRFDLFRTKAGR